MRLWLSLQEASQAQQDGDQARLSRAWKLFLLLPRMLLWRHPRGGLVPKRHLESRLRLLVAGEWDRVVAARCGARGRRSSSFRPKASTRTWRRGSESTCSQGSEASGARGNLSRQTSVGRRVCCTRDFENVEGSFGSGETPRSPHVNLHCQSCHITFHGHGLCWTLNCVPPTCGRRAIRNELSISRVCLKVKMILRCWLSWRTVWAHKCPIGYRACIVFGAHHRIAETRQRGAGHCCRRVHSPVGGGALWRSNFSQQAKEATAPYQHAFGNPRRVRVRGTRHPSIDGPQ